MRRTQYRAQVVLKGQRPKTIGSIPCLYNA